MRSWFGGLARSARKILAGPYNILRGIFPVSWGEPPTRGTRELLEGHDTMPWLRAVADKVGYAIGCTEWVLMSVRRGGRPVREVALQRAGFASREKSVTRLRDAGEIREESDHVFWTALSRPNPFMGQLALLKVTEAHLDLVGESYWVKDRNALGVLAGFWPVPPHWVIERPLPDRPTYTIRYANWQVTIPEREMIAFIEPSPAHPYTRGSGVGWTLGDELEVDEYAAKMAKALFFNQARPDFVVYGFDSPEEKRRLERDWTNRLQGFWKAHKPYFMTGEPKFHEFQRPTMDQLVYPNLRKAQRDIVLQTYGAPPELFGIVENSNRATIEAAEYLFSKWVVSPRVERIRQVLQRVVEEEYDERLVLHFISPIVEDKEFVLKVARVAGRTVDEWRQLQGLQPIGGDEGAAYMIPAGGMVVDDLLEMLQQGQQQGKRPPAASS